MTLRVLHVSCNVRSVRIAFIVGKPDPAILEEVFRVNTLLWGGLLNPLVVLDNSTRKTVGRHYQFIEMTYEEEIRSLLHEFDPDLLISLDNSALPDSCASFKDRFFGKDVLRWNPWGHHEVPFFLEVWPFLRNYYRSEVRFAKDNPPHKFAYMEPEDPIRTYLAAAFGTLADEDEGKKILTEHFAAKPVKYDEFRKAPKNEWVFPITTTAFDLQIRSPKPGSSDIFFLMNPLEMHDVVDYWNLRAAGFSVFGLPVDSYKDQGERAKGFARWAMDPSVPKPFAGPSIVKARSVEDDAADEAAQWLVSLESEFTPSVMGWVPRFGVRGVMMAEPDVVVRPPTAKDLSQNVMMNDTSGEIQFQAPRELSDSDQSQHWAVDLTVFGASEETTFRLPWLKPSCDNIVKLSLGHGSGPAGARVSKHGVVVIAHGDRDHSLIHEPKVTTVFKAYLKDSNIAYLRTSSAGLALDRVVEQLGGYHRCQIFQNTGVRELVDVLSDGSPKPQQFVKGAIYRAVATEEDQARKGREILERLISEQLLRQGFELQCDKCQRCDWYHLSEIAEQFKCKKCFHVQLVPLLDRHTWSYISNGLFRLEGKISGCMTTIMAIIFFRFCFGFDTKIVSSFDYVGPEGAGERDFAIFSSDTFQEDIDVIVGECKTTLDLGQKEKKDIKDMALATGAYIAFAIDAPDFSPDDKAYFKELINAAIRPILLTRKHLEMPYIQADEYRHKAFRVRKDAEALHRLTVIEILGDEFARENNIWV